MKKKITLLIILFLLVGLTLLISVPALAGGGDPTPTKPPPEPADCSPGFWKNHTEIWEGDGGIEPTGMYDSSMTYLDALQGGKDTKVSRFDVAGQLNLLYPDACD